MRVWGKKKRTERNINKIHDIHDDILVPLLTCSNETIVWNEKERLRIKVLLMDNLRCLLGIRK